MIVHLRSSDDLRRALQDVLSKTTLHLVVHCSLDEIAKEMMPLLGQDGVYSVVFIGQEDVAKRLARFVKDTPIFSVQDGGEADRLVAELIKNPISQVVNAYNADEVTPRFLQGFPT